MRPAATAARLPVAVTRRRRAFGLDAPRPPNLPRIETAIVDWLAAQMPHVACLRVASGPRDAEDPTAATLALLLPAGRTAILRIDLAPARPGPASSALVRQCRARRIPIDIVTGIEDVRAALRRLGLEPEEE